MKVTFAVFVEPLLAYWLSNEVLANCCKIVRLHDTHHYYISLSGLSIKQAGDLLVHFTEQ